MAGVILDIKGLTIRYGAVEAVRGIDLAAEEKGVTVLLGANGAGKTSTLHAISGLTAVSSGRIRFQGEDITHWSTEKIARLGIALSPEGRKIFTDLSVLDNLKAGAYTLRDKKIRSACFERVYHYFPVLKDRSRQIAGTLSGGELQMLAIGRALMSNPKVLLLDEPSLGLAPLIVKDIFRIIQEIRQEGITVVIVEQNARQTLHTADYGYVLEIGKIKMHGKAEDLLQDKRLIEAYLGNAD